MTSRPTVLFCRNRVLDYDRWYAYFTADPEAQHRAGLHLVQLYRDAEEPLNVFFLFEVSDVDKARAFLADPVNAEIGEKSGVVDGEFHFLVDADGYDT